MTGWRRVLARPARRSRGALLLAVLAAACSTPLVRPPPEPRRTVEVSPTPLPVESPTPKATRKRPVVLRCRYAFPVRPSDVAHYGAAHHDYPATDIFAPEGSDFVSPTDGRVDFVSRVDRWDPSIDDPATRGGLSIAIIGKDGVRYYGSHLRDIEPDVARGRRVHLGQKLGEIGTSGNARGISPHLHFGISHPSFSTDWRVRRGEVSPFDYLNAWRHGDDVTPDVPGADRAQCKAGG